MEKQVTRNKSQAGFSLIELLVVVAIIGVLAAAGIVGYGRYLDGVKEDTSKNNAKVIAQALKAELTILTGGLTAQNCSGAALNAAGNNFSTDTVAFTCANSIISNGKFKDPYTGGTLDAQATCAAGKVKVTLLGVEACNKTGGSFATPSVETFTN